MRYLRRLTTIIVGCAAWCMVAATAAYAQLPAVPAGSGDSVVVVPGSTSATGTSAWQFVGTAALGALVALVVLGLVFSLRHSRRSEPRLHA